MCARAFPPVFVRSCVGACVGARGMGVIVCGMGVIVCGMGVIVCGMGAWVRGVGA